MIRQLLVLGIILGWGMTLSLYAQDQGNFSGSLELNSNFFLRDSTIGASNTPQYDNQLAGGEAWLNLNYSYKGFDFALRFDAYQNSNVKNPLGSYSAQGIGFWQIHKKINKLDITAGHFYDQIGTGIIYRAYEQRPLFIDNSLTGFRLIYDLLERDAGELTIKTFAGRQRRSFAEDREDIVARAYKPIVKGLALDGFWGNENGKISIAPGFGIVNRTLDEGTMNLIVSEINTYAPEDAFVPKYNVYAATLYNTLTAGNFTWYAEGAFKSHETINNPFIGKLVDESGYVTYTSLGYSQKGFSVTGEYKRTENFTLKTSPLEPGILGNMHFLPPMNPQNTYRLTARYNPATQEIGENAFLLDINVSPKRTLNFNLSYSNISRLNSNMAKVFLPYRYYQDDFGDDYLFREMHLSARYRKPKKFSIVGGFQIQEYNQEVYEEKPNAPIVKTIVEYVDFLYKFNKKLSLRVEAQYMYTKQDYGSWLFGLAELSISPHWIFTVSDMYNVSPTSGRSAKHYPTASVVYNYKANRFSLAYVKQVEGIVCTGGICRYEPAFSGVRFGVTSAF